MQTWLQMKTFLEFLPNIETFLFVSAKISYLSIWIVHFVKYLNTLLQLDVSKKK